MIGPRSVANIASPKLALPLVTTLPAIQVGIETIIQATNSATAISTICRIVTLLGNRDENTEIISNCLLERLYYKILVSFNDQSNLSSEFPIIIS